MRNYQVDQRIADNTRYTVAKPGVRQLVHDDVNKRAVSRQESGCKES
jgi:hypothetical protein